MTENPEDGIREKENTVKIFNDIYILGKSLTYLPRMFVLDRFTYFP